MANEIYPALFRLFIGFLCEFHETVYPSIPCGTCRPRKATGTELCACPCWGNSRTLALTIAGNPSTLWKKTARKHRTCVSTCPERDEKYWCLHKNILRGRSLRGTDWGLIVWLLFDNLYSWGRFIVWNPFGFFPTGRRGAKLDLRDRHIGLSVSAIEQNHHNYRFIIYIRTKRVGNWTSDLRATVASSSCTCFLYVYSVPWAFCNVRGGRVLLWPTIKEEDKTLQLLLQHDVFVSQFTTHK